MIASTRSGLVRVPDGGDAADSLRLAISETVGRLTYNYQFNYLADRSLRKAMLWSRQVGKSRTISGENVLDAIGAAGRDEVMTSASDIRAQELLRTAKWWSDIFDDLAKAIVGRSIYHREPTESKITYWNGSRVLSHPANPRTASGYTGPVTMDEASKILHDDEMWTALDPITSSGPFPFRMSGTPWGARGVFWEVCTGQKPGWSLHTITIHDAVRMGCPRDVDYIRSQYDALTFAQEYECQFLSKQLCPFTPDLVRMCVDLDLFDAPPVGTRVDGRLVRYALGIDVGRTNDRTDLVFIAEWPKGFYQVTRRIPMQDVSFGEQFKAIVPWLDNPGIEVVGIDANGLGMQLAEDCYNHAPGKVKQVHLMNQNKAAMVALTLARAESGHLKLLHDQDLLTDLGSIERHVLPSSGAVSYRAKRSEKGHADSAFALFIGLSLLADTSGRVQFDFGYGTDIPVGGADFKDGGLDVLGTIAESRPLAHLLTPGPESLYSPEEIRAMSEDEKEALGLVVHAPLQGQQRRGPFGMEIIGAR